MTSSIFDQLTTLLEQNGARFRIVEHPPEGKSDLVAQLRGTKPSQGAKAMLCKSRDHAGRWLLAVLPGDRKLDFKKVAQAMGAKRATLASPEEAMTATGCAIGAIPPFSFSTAVELVVDPILVEGNPQVAFNAGRLDRSMVLDTKDYLRIARPLLAPLIASTLE